MVIEKQLMLLRHAKAEVAEAGKADHDRALTTRGIHEARQMARYLNEQQIDPEMILCSTSVRTRQTERELRAVTRLSADTLFLAELYLAPWEEIVKAVRAFSGPEIQRLLVIGHNPGLEECAARLTGELVLLSTGALAMIGLKEADLETFGETGCELQGIVSAKSLMLDED